MSQYSKLIITKQGQTLLAGLFTGEKNGVRFTRVCVSDKEYDLSELENLTELSGVRQESLVSHAEVSSESAVTVEAAFTNEKLTEGYYMRTIGLYAAESEDSEILYAVTVEQSGSCYMPPFNGVTMSGAVINLIAAVGNAENISLETSSAALATVNDIKRLEEALSEHNSSSGSHEDIRRLALNSVQQGEVYTKAESDALLGNAVSSHNEGGSAHADIRGELSRLSGDVAVLKLKYATNITANAFAVTFETLDGLSVDGVHNTGRGTVDF